jgi:hypothetical protein
MPRFVILEHRWDGVHFDLMLEDEGAGVLRTWAVDEPIVAGRELSARALPGHRLAYLDYEGPISGGRGAVRRIDRGTFEADVWRADRVEALLAGQSFRVPLRLRAAEAGGESRETSAPAAWLAFFGNVD